MERVDLLILGRGVAGLAAALHGAVEGLDTLALGPDPGRLAGSTAVENYVGFNKIPGVELLAQAEEQARLQGARVLNGKALAYGGRDIAGEHIVYTTIGEIHARVVLLALGVRFPKPECETTARLSTLPDSGVIVGTPYGLEGRNHVVVVGGSNGGGQAALYLNAKGVPRVTLLHRKDLRATMSQYLLSRVQQRAIETLPGHGFKASQAGDSCIIAVETDKGAILECDGLSLYTGGSPSVPEGFPVDERGYVPTGAGFQTPISGIYAVGDCRAGAHGRAQVASGEAAVAVADLASRHFGERWNASLTKN